VEKQQENTADIVTFSDLSIQDNREQRVSKAGVGGLNDYPGGGGHLLVTGWTQGQWKEEQCSH